MIRKHTGVARWDRWIRISCGGLVRQGVKQAVAMFVTAALVLAPAAWADRTPLQPGWNIFSPKQDVEIGREVSRDAERQLPLMNDSRVESYQIGRASCRERV